MNWNYTPYTAVLHLTAIISFCIALLLLASQERSWHRCFNFVDVGHNGMGFCFRHGSGHGGGHTENTLVQNRIPGGGYRADAFHAFYIGIPPDNPLPFAALPAVYSVVPLAALVLAMTNDWHGLIWNSFRMSLTEPNTLIYGHGSGFYVLVAYDYLLVLIGMVIMLRAWFQAKQPFRQHIGIILISSIFPAITGIVYILGLNPFPGLDITPISFMVTGLILALGVIHFGLFGVGHIAPAMY